MGQFDTKAKPIDLKAKLVDLLTSAITNEEFKDLLYELRDDSLGRAIVDSEAFNAAHRINFLRLLRACNNYGGGLEKLWEVLAIFVDKTRAIRTDLEQSFQAYQDARRQLPQAGQLELTDCVHEASKLGITLRASLHALASKYEQLEPKRLQEAIGKAMSQAFPDVSPSNVFPSVFGQGPITNWADLLSRTSQDPFELDQRFLAALAEALALPQAVPGQPDPPVVSSLIVMVLRPPHLPASAECHEYGFRAYFCPHEAAAPDQWSRLDAKVTDYPIRAAAWVADLQVLLTKAIRASPHQWLSADATPLLEIFLPGKYLNEDIGELIQMQLPTDEWEPLNKYYPIVLRSSDRYQFFHEGQAKEFPNPLPAKWERARRRAAAAESMCCWWHDPTPASRNHSQKAEKEIEEQFDMLRVKSEYFALKRTANLPACPQLQQKWLNRMIWACPAVALWWRPKARSSEAERRESLRFSCGEHGHLFDSRQLSEHQPAQADHFTHPDTASPLKLFHAFASVVFHGRRSTDHSRAFRELVLLMDSEERWPPPLDRPPSAGRKSEQGREVVTVSEEEILFSG